MREIIIVGSGIGGLTVGNLLLKKGHKVTMFESHSMPGGYTAGFFRKGFYFESGTLSFESSASVFRAMKYLGVFDKIKFVKQRTRMISDDLDIMPATYEDFKQAIYSAYPSEKSKLDGFFNELGRMVKAMAAVDKPAPYLYSGIGHLVNTLSYTFGIAKNMNVFKQYSEVTTSEFIGRYFDKYSKLYRLFTSYGNPDMTSYFLGTAASGTISDYWTVKDGMQSWANILAENFKKLGGVLKLNSYVDKIITEKGTAIGVSSKGTDYHADYVISAGDYKKTLLELLDDKSLVPDGLLKKIKEAPVSESFFTVYLGLDMPAEELAKHMKTPYVSYLDKKPGCDIYNPDDKDYFDKTFILLYSTSMINSKHAPDKKSALMIQTLAPHRWMQNWGGGDREKYKLLKDMAMEAVIEKASKIIPGLKDAIEYKDAATPLTYEKFTYNTDGASTSWSWNPKKKFYEQKGMSINTSTPVNNLFISSSWAFQVGGVPSAVGAAFMCAKKIK